MVLRFFRNLSNNYSNPDSLARRATNDEIFGPSTEDLHNLTKLTYKPKACAKILNVLEHRLRQSGRHWRQKSKTLTILQFFMIHGSPECSKWVRQREDMLIELGKFQYIDSRNNDQGRAVRDKAESLLQVLRDPEKLEEAKAAYKSQKEGLRRSIGAGRPSTQSRNTLEMIRDNIFDEDHEDIHGAFRSAIASTNNPLTAVEDVPRVTTGGGLCAIEEER